LSESKSDIGVQGEGRKRSEKAEKDVKMSGKRAQRKFPFRETWKKNNVIVIIFRNGCKYRKQQ
jgi:hypothetical protein